MSDLAIAATISLFWRVRRLFSSVWIQALKVSSKMKISQALLNIMGASPLII